MKDFTTYEQALELKELGFNEPCFGAFLGKELKLFHFSNDLKGYVNDNNLIVATPTFSQAFRWFRDKYGLSGWVDEGYSTDGRRGVVSVKSEKGLKYLKQQKTTQFFNTYEEAELACLNKLIEIVKNK